MVITFLILKIVECACCARTSASSTIVTIALSKKEEDSDEQLRCFSGGRGGRGGALPFASCGLFLQHLFFHGHGALQMQAYILPFSSTTVNTVLCLLILSKKPIHGFHLLLDQLIRL